MTFTRDGARFRKRPRNPWLLPLVIGVEVVLSFFVYVSFAAHTLWPEDTKAAAGIASVLSYEGRLMDASGNPLGGTGTAYCFRFSIYDAPTGGTKLWPAGTPNNTTATSTDGVFSALIGQADSLTFNFFDNDTVYLNVDVNTTATTCGGSWESLSPRQRIAATGYAQSAKNTYGGAVQVGTGVGGGSPSFLSLDVKNTNDYVGQSCTTSGTMWYNSAISKALVCENGTIQTIGNSSATTTLAAINANAGTPATTGTIVFSNSNGVTFGINGNTITASVAAGGGGVGTVSTYINHQPASTGSQTFGAMGGTTGSVLFFPVSIESNVHFNAIRIAMNFSYATSSVSGRQTVTHNYGLYSLNGSTLSLISGSNLTYNITNSSVSATLSAATATATTGYGYGSITASTTAQIHSLFGTRGLRAIDLQFGNTMSLTPGMYWLGYQRRDSSSSANVGLSMGIAGNVMAIPNAMGRIGSHSDSLTTNFGLKYPFFAFGPYTSTGSAGYGGTTIPTSAFVSGIAHTGSNLPFMTFIST